MNEKDFTKPNRWNSNEGLTVFLKYIFREVYFVVAMKSCQAKPHKQLSKQNL